MSTWGKKEIKINPEYGDLPLLHYEYNTTSDTFCFIETWRDDYTNEIHKTDYYLSDDTGRAMMEAFIDLVIGMDNLTSEQFVEKFVTNNRFRRPK